MFRDPQINLYVTDVEASLRFYCENFGFTETFRTPPRGAPIHAEMRLGGLVLGAATIESARGIHGLELGGGAAPRGEVVVWTDDLDGAFEQITARGAPPLSQPHDFLADLRAAWIADLDGNPLQMVMRRAR
jgi:catechol 2,3-dioxygenase-like lactoylglutathione lyase family enzyme